MRKRVIFALFVVLQLAAVAGVRTEFMPLPSCFPCDVR